jgi:hypothetical protein
MGAWGGAWLGSEPGLGGAEKRAAAAAAYFFSTASSGGGIRIIYENTRTLLAIC